MCCLGGTSILMAMVSLRPTKHDYYILLLVNVGVLQHINFLEGRLIPLNDCEVGIYIYNYTISCIQCSEDDADRQRQDGIFIFRKTLINFTIYA